jgi:hypothetical protein
VAAISSKKRQLPAGRLANTDKALEMVKRQLHLSYPLELNCARVFQILNKTRRSSSVLRMASISERLTGVGDNRRRSVLRGTLHRRAKLARAMPVFIRPAFEAIQIVPAFRRLHAAEHALAVAELRITSWAREVRRGRIWFGSKTGSPFDHGSPRNMEILPQPFPASLSGALQTVNLRSQVGW